MNGINFKIIVSTKDIPIYVIATKHDKSHIYAINCGFVINNELFLKLILWRMTTFYSII